MVKIDYGLGKMAQIFSEIKGFLNQYMIFKELEEAKDRIGV